MNKIGILTCIHSNNVCARVGCLAERELRDDKKLAADIVEGEVDLVVLVVKNAMF